MAVRTLLSLLAAAALAAALAACGGGEDLAQRSTTAPAAPAAGDAAGDERAATGGGAPAALARNAAEADRIGGQGPEALRRRLDALRGNPVVVNVWASWCPPCRAELPFFERAARRHRERVAFVGIDYLDNREAAEEFLARVPSGFPSVFDPDGRAARSIGAGRAMPTTLFVAPDGEVAHAKLGGYANAGLLEADIREHLLR